MSDFVKKEDAIRICKMCASAKYRVPYIEQAFENISTIDAVSVVRCKDCIHFDGFDCNRFGEPAEYNSPYSDDGNDFCSFGERREP